MMQPAQSRIGNHLDLPCRFDFDGPTQRCVLVKRIVNAILLIVGDVFADQPPQVAFVERNDMVEKFSATTSHPAFGDAVLPRRGNTRPFRLNARRLQERDDFGVELRISIEDDIAVGDGLGKGFTQLLDDPFGTRMGSDVGVKNLTSTMLDDKEAIEQLECHGRDGEEVKRHDYLALIREESPPTLSGITATADSSQIASNGWFGYNEAELLEFTVDIGSAPTWILLS